MTAVAATSARRQVKKRKKELSAFLGLEDAVKAARAGRDAARAALEAHDAATGELAMALRKLELAARLGCRAVDLVERRLALCVLAPTPPAPTTFYFPVSCVSVF